MTRLLVLTVALGLFSPLVAFGQDAATVARGEKVYAAQKCIVCHSIAGKGNQKGPLDGVGSKLSAEEIRMWIVDATAMTAKTKAARRPVMRSYPNLPKEELEGLIAYMQSLKK